MQRTSSYTEPQVRVVGFSASLQVGTSRPESTAPQLHLRRTASFVSGGMESPLSRALRRAQDAPHSPRRACPEYRLAVAHNGCPALVALAFEPEQSVPPPRRAGMGPARHREGLGWPFIAEKASAGMIASSRMATGAREGAKNRRREWTRTNAPGGSGRKRRLCGVESRCRCQSRVRNSAGACSEAWRSFAATCEIASQLLYMHDMHSSYVSKNSSDSFPLPRSLDAGAHACRVSQGQRASG